MYRNTILLIAALLTSALWAGCGGGGGGNNLPQTSANVTFNTTSTDSAVQIKGIDIEVILPAGVTIATEPGTNEISSTVLKGAGTAGRPFGRYSAAIRKVKIVVPFSSSTIALGSYATLSCGITPGTILSENDFANMTIPFFDVTGPGGTPLNSNPNNPNDQTNKVRSSITAAINN